MGEAGAEVQAALRLHAQGSRDWMPATFPEEGRLLPANEAESLSCLSKC